MLTALNKAPASAGRSVRSRSAMWRTDMQNNTAVTKLSWADYLNFFSKKWDGARAKFGLSSIICAAGSPESPARDSSPERIKTGESNMATQPNALSVSEHPQSLAVEVLQPVAALQSTEIISAEELENLTDEALVEYAACRIVKFAMDIRPVLVEVHTRFFAEKKAGRSFLGYTDFDKFCLDALNYTSRQIRNIISGTPTPTSAKSTARKPRCKPSRQVVEEGLERQAAQAHQEGIREGRRIERESIKQTLKTEYERGLRDGAKAGSVPESRPAETAPEPVQPECVLRLTAEERKVVAQTLEAMKSYRDPLLAAAPGGVLLLQTDALVVVHKQSQMPSQECWKLGDALQRGNRKQVGKAVANRLEDYARKLDTLRDLSSFLSLSVEGTEKLFADESMSASRPSLRRVLSALQRAQADMRFVTPPSEA